MATDFKLVTDVSGLEVGKKVIITNADASYGLGVQNSNNRKAVALTKNDNLITVDGTTNAAVTVLTLGQSDGKYTFFDEGKGYLYAASSSSNYLKTQATLNDNGKCTIAIVNNVATIKFQGTNKNNWLRYNSSSTIFSCYSSGQKDVAIYQEYVPAAVADPVITVANGTYFVGDEVTVTLSCSEADATIHYTTDGTVPTAETTTTVTSFVLKPTAAGSVTIKAIAVKNDKTSNVVSKVVAINPVANTVAEYNAMKTGTIVRFDCDLKISIANTNHIFAQDAAGNGVFMYSKSGIGEAANGKVIPAKGLIGKVSTYNSNKQLNFSDYSLPTLSDGETIAPITVQFGALNDSYLYKYVMIPDVTLEKGADVVLYNVNGVTGFLVNEYGLKNWPTTIDGKTFNIYGIYVIKSTERNLYFVDAKEVVVTLADPTLDVPGGSYDKEQTVNITADDGAEVRYTTNETADIKYGVAGKDYTVGKTLTIDKSCTLRVIAVKGEEFSNVLSATYVMKTATPEITLGDDKKVSITTGYSDGVTIYYTTDGTPATTESAVYNAPFSILRGSIVNAVEKYKEFDLSDAAKFNYSQEQSVTFGMEDYGVNNNTEIKDTPFTKGDVTIVYGGGGSSVTKYYTEAIRLYNSNNITVSSKNGIIASVTFSGVPSGYEFGKVEVTAGEFSNNVWSNINAKTATLTNKKTSQVRFTTITVNYILPEAAASITGINEAGTYYTVNFELNGQAANDGVLYARTSEPSAKPSEPNKNYFDKSYEDYDLSKYAQRDWVAINGNTELVGKTLTTGFIARYDGVKLTPVAAIAYNGDAASYTLNTFGVANVFYGNYENTDKVMGDYKPFFGKAKVNEVAYYVGEVKAATDGGLELWGSGVCGKLNEKGLKIEANGIEITASAKYQQIEGVLVADAEANGGVKIVALSAPTTPTGVAALKADGKATVYGTEGAVVVNGADGKVMIFDAMGRMVKSVNAEGAATVAMPAGYYIVRTAGTAAKVMVK